MKLIKRLLIICLSFALLLSGCGKSSKANNVTHNDISPLYTEAVTNLNMAGAFSLNIITNKTTYIGNECYTEDRAQSMTVDNYGSDQLEAHVSETVTINNQSYKTEQYYAEGYAYLEIDNSYFSSPLSSDEFLAQFTPFVPINIANYNSVTTEESNDDTTILFSDPSKSESWLSCDDAKLITASGTVTINSDHQFIANQYQVEYVYTSARVVQTTQMAFSYNSEAITLPDTSGYREIASIVAPQTLESAYIYMNLTNAAATASEYYIDSKAFGVNRRQNTRMTMSGENDTFTAYFSTDVEQQNYSRNHAPISASQTVTFKDHKYTDSSDPTASENSISWTDMQQKCRNNLTGNIPSLSHIQNTTISESSDYILLSITATPETGQSIIKNASQALYGDPDFIAFISDSIDDASTECYLTINEKTGLPTSAGFTFQTKHSVDGTTYPISAQFHQSISLANDIGEIDSENTTIQPLLYEVTSNNGSRMWILGNTQYGDRRSNQLPQKVYDALTTSQMLITEYSYDNLADTVGADPNTNAYNRSNPGTNNDAYNSAQFYLHVSGNMGVKIYHRSAAYWNYILTNHAITQDHRLSQRYSVLANILRHAESSEKKIEVLYPDCSTIQFMAKLTEAEQEALLTNTITDLPAVAQNAYDEFSALCEGNTAVLAELYDSNALTTIATNNARADIFEKLTGYLQNPSTTFAVLDARYLVSENNLITQLDSAGYIVKKVTY